MALSQTSPAPAVSSTTPSVTVTPVILSSTTPGCTAFNASTCEPCAPGSQSDNSKPAGRVLSPPPSCRAGPAKVQGVSSPADTLMCSCCPAPGRCLFPGACLPCSKGFYQPLPGRLQCWPCNRGYYAKYTHTLSAHSQLLSAALSFTRVTVLSVLLAVLYASPARLVPSATGLEQRAARGAHQVGFPVCFVHIISKSVETCLVCRPQVSIRPIRVPLHVHRVHWELSASKLAPA